MLASNWHKLFDDDPADERNYLSWANCFGNFTGKIQITNFYSSEEDALAKVESRDITVFGLWFSSGFEFARGAYKAQEYIKGAIFNLGNFVMIRGQAGWDKAETRYINRNMNDIEDSELKIGPYFRKFREKGLMSINVNIASSLAAQPRVKYDLLARGIPALTYAAGVSEISGPSATNIEEYDMSEDGRFGQWPNQGHEIETKAEQWLHSDFRNVSLNYVIPMYIRMIEKAGLNEK